MRGSLKLRTTTWSTGDVDAAPLSTDRTARGETGALPMNSAPTPTAVTAAPRATRIAASRAARVTAGQPCRRLPDGRAGPVARGRPPRGARNGAGDRRT